MANINIAEQAAAADKPPLPVTLLSGFLGSGKTSLLKHILLNRQGLRVAVILNEISEVNIDSFALEGSRLLQAEEKVVELSNGCICCTLREDLLKQLRELHASGRYDAVLVESSGIAEPLQTAETFLIDLEDGHKALQDGIAPLDCCVTVLDASTAMEYLGDHIAVKPTRAAAAAEGQDEAAAANAGKEAPTNGETISDLFYDQLSFANVVVLNKVDLLIQRHHAATRKLQKAKPSLSPEQEQRDEKAIQALKEYDQQFPPHSRMSSSLSSSTVSTAQQNAAAEALNAMVPTLAMHSAVQELLSRLKAMCPRAAETVISCHGVLPLEKVLRTGHFTMDFATQSDGWMHDILSGEAHVPETLEYGVSTTYFTANRPFHPERFFLWLDQYFVLRQMVPGDEDEEGEEQGGEQGHHTAANDEGGAASTSSTEVATADHLHPELDDLDSEEGSVTSSWGEGGQQEDDDEEEDGNEESDDEEESESGDEGSSDDEETARETQSAARRQRYGNLFRGKGYVWLGNPKRLGQVASLSQAGSELQLQYVGTWEDDFVDIAKNAQSSDPHVSEHVDRPTTSRSASASSKSSSAARTSSGLLGPSPTCVYAPPAVASQRLVFIGQHLLQDHLLQDLEAALLTDEEWTQLQQHMHQAMIKNAEREALQKKMSWRDRGWLNDIFEDYFEDFPLPLTPPKIPEAVVAAMRRKATKSAGHEKEAQAHKKKRPRDEW